MAYGSNRTNAGDLGATTRGGSQRRSSSAASRTGQVRRSTSARSRRTQDASAPFFGQAAPVLQPEYECDVRVIGTGSIARGETTPSLVSTTVKMLAVVIVLIAVLSFVRIALTSNAVTTMIQSDSISAQISEARSAGTSLEMEQSVLTSPSAVKAQAKKMGMAAPAQTTTIMLEPDVVAIKNGDTLSLSDTIKNIVQIDR